MTKLHIIAQLEIHPGKLEGFKQAAAECVALIREKSPGTLQYNWYLNEEQTACTVLEVYQDSEAVLVHMGSLSEVAPRLLACADLSAEIFGNPSPELKQALAPMSAKFYPTWLGLEA